MLYPDDLKYSRDHEWVRDDGGIYAVGITQYAADELGDITYVDLPEEGLELNQGDVVATVESVKAASDVYAPIAGTVIEVNMQLEATPELVNQSPYDDGWIFTLEDVKPSQYRALMDAKAYEAYVAGLSKE